MSAETAGLQVGEVGVKIVLNTGLATVAGYDAYKIRARRPDGVERTYTAVVEGLATSGKISYTFVEGDLDLRGIWVFFAQLETAGGAVLKGESIKVRVKAEFEV